jgi:hypothetical protein
MHATTWKWVAVALHAGAIGAGVVFAFGPKGEKLPLNAAPGAVPVAADNPAPPAKDGPKGEWLPKLKLLDGVLEEMPKSIAWVDAPPSAFPELKLPERAPNAPFGPTYDAAVAKLCPRVLGKTAIVLGPTDGTLEKLLKARLHRGIIQWLRHRELLRCGTLNTSYSAEIIEGLVDMEAVCLELWGGQPKELIPWLEELVIAAKEFEQFQTIRALRDNGPPYRLDLAVRHRLRAEATLWKAKNRK